MAASENQGTQIALIIFVILTVILAITSFLFYRQYDSARLEREQASALATTADNKARETQAEINEIKSLILGFPEDATLDTIKTTHAQEIAQYAATYPVDAQTYRTALIYMYDTTLRDVIDRNTLALAENDRLKTENEEREAARQQQIKQHSDAAVAAEASQRQQQQAFQATVAQLEATKTDLQNQNDELRRGLDRLNAESTKEKADLNGIIQQLRNTLRGKITELEEVRTETFEVPDGLVRRVEQRTGIVYINLGRADNLNRSVTFSVHDQLSNTLLGDGLKGRIEVTDVVGPHLSLARIVEDKVADPIVPGDLIYSPLWHPGRLVRFAFAGVLDMDGDGKSDRGAIHDLVKIAGGEIDAEVTDAGDRTGQLTLATRYLVLGDQPEEGAAFEGYSQIQTEAGQLGTKIISFEKFLDSVGWKDSSRVIQFGTVGDPADFLRPVPDGGRRNSQGSTTDLFRRRNPREMLPAAPREERPAGAAAPGPM